MSTLLFKVTSQNENAYQGAKNKIGKVWKKRAKVPSQGLGRILGRYYNWDFRILTYSVFIYSVSTIILEQTDLRF